MIVKLQRRARHTRCVTLEAHLIKICECYADLSALCQAHPHTHAECCHRWHLLCSVRESKQFPADDDSAVHAKDSVNNRSCREKESRGGKEATASRIWQVGACGRVCASGCVCVCVFATVKCHENCIIVTSLMQFKCFYNYKKRKRSCHSTRSAKRNVAEIENNDGIHCVSACGKVSTVAAMKNLCCILLGAQNEGGTTAAAKCTTFWRRAATTKLIETIK